MDTKKTIGNISFPTVTALALWNGEVKGQLSDGTWENSRPYDHFKLWFTLRPVVGNEAKVTLDAGVGPQYGQRTKYNIVGLMTVKWDKGDPGYDTDPYVLRGRMLKMGRMAKAAKSLGRDAADTHACEYMPATYGEWAALKASGDWEHDFIGRYMAEIDDELAQAYYAAEYTAKELKADLLAIKAAMASLPTTYPG